MVTSVPAWFGSKARTRKPLALDVTTITDTSGSMVFYIDYITSDTIYQSLEASLRSQNIGVSPENENRYSFCVAKDKRDVKPPLSEIERDVTIQGSPGARRWVTGPEVTDTSAPIDYPDYEITGGDGENVAASLNTIQTKDRDYNTSSQRITIGGTDTPFYMADIIEDVEYPSIFIGVHSIIIRALSEDPSAGIPPTPRGQLVGFVYTTDTVGTAIYIDGTTINYRENMPTFGISVTSRNSDLGIPRSIRKLVDQAIATNGAVYDIEFFTTPEKYALLTESLGAVLGKYLYSLT